MKKKILAAALAAVIALNVCSVRPKAAAAAGIMLTIGSAAVFLMGVFTGQYDDTANGIGAVLTNGVDGFEKAFVGTEKTFCGRVIESEDAWIVTGYKQICHQIESWVNSGEATIDENGNLTIDYQQYLDLYSILAELVDLTVDIGTSIPYNVVSYPVGTPFAFTSMPVFCDLSSSSFNQSYFPVYYSSDKIYFSESYLNINLSSYMMGSSFAVSRGFGVRGINGIGSSSIGDTVFPDIHYITAGLDKCIGVFDSNSNFLYSRSAYLSNSDASFSVSSFTCYDGTSLQSVPASSIDTSSLSFSYLVCSGQGSEFITSIRSYAASRDTSSLDDLSGTLPLDKTSNPDLIISSDGGIGKATDAITVSSVPGVADTTLTNYMTDVKTDIDVPSIIIEKFPFCIPFDFYNIISTLCADPVAPVFRIPISTNPDNLQGLEGNETIGKYLPGDDYKPLFKVDEEIVLDLSTLPLLQPVCYTIFIVGFIVLLIMLTPKLIQH